MLAIRPVMWGVTGPMDVLSMERVGTTGPGMDPITTPGPGPGDCTFGITRGMAGVSGSLFRTVRSGLLSVMGVGADVTTQVGGDRVGIDLIHDLTSGEAIPESISTGTSISIPAIARVAYPLTCRRGIRISTTAPPVAIG